jgi:hypothetical protein
VTGQVVVANDASSSLGGVVVAAAAADGDAAVVVNSFVASDLEVFVNLLSRYQQDRTH